MSDQQETNDIAVGDGPTNVAGVWIMNVEAMGQSLEVKMTLEQTGVPVHGTLESSLVNGDITGLAENNMLNAVSQAKVMGMNVQLNLGGTVNGDSMEGWIETNMPQIPNIPFNAKRQS